MKNLNVAIVGVGGYGGVILKEIFEKGQNGFRIVAAVDLYAEKSALYSEIKTRNIPVYGNMEQMFSDFSAKNEQIDFVYIATPIQFHAEQIRCAVLHGAHVLCEKPLTGDARDIEALQKLEKSTGKMIAVGYQWSYSAAIQKLKRDVMNGEFGKPLFLKSLVFWPRDKAYFTRSTGWAGKLYDGEGRKIADSIANNATAHYIHNMLYVTGREIDGAAEAVSLDATLLRTNDIQTFDTVTARFILDNGARCLFAASHSTISTVEPRFEYVFEKGKVAYSAESGTIAAVQNDGDKKEYGDPFADGAAYKFYSCIDAVRRGENRSLCGVNAAKEQVKFIEMLHKKGKTFVTKKDRVSENDGFLRVRGLDELLLDCYEEEKILEEISTFGNFADAPAAGN